MTRSTHKQAIQVYKFLEPILKQEGEFWVFEKPFTVALVAEKTGVSTYTVQQVLREEFGELMAPSSPGHGLSLMSVTSRVGKLETFAEAAKADIQNHHRHIKEILHAIENLERAQEQITKWGRRNGLDAPEGRMNHGH